MIVMDFLKILGSVFLYTFGLIIIALVFLFCVAILLVGIYMGVECGRLLLQQFREEKRNRKAEKDK